MSKIDFSIFRGYDIRATVPEQLNEDVVRLIAKAYASFLYRRQITEAVIVQDNRLTSEEFKKYFIEELLSSGIDVIDNGLGLSPTMYFSQYHYLSKGGVMVTASHNPANYNGFKLANGFSDTLVTEEIQELVEIIKNKEFKKYGQKGN